MAGTSPRTVAIISAASPDDFVVSELASSEAGATSPFGETEFPMPFDQLTYRHPRPEDRPHLAEGR
jgi:hypothetical protein